MGIVITVSASTTPTAALQEKVQIIAHEYKVASSTIYAIIESETGGTWNTDQECDGGDGRGLACINKRWFPKEYEQALDPEFSIRFIAQAIKDDKEHALFSGCSCIASSRALGAKVPKVKNAKDLKPNTDFPQKGGLVKFNYNHIAVVQKVSEEGIYIREGNYTKCKFTNRLIKWNDPKVLGYWYDPAIDS